MYDVSNARACVRACMCMYACIFFRMNSFVASFVIRCHMWPFFCDFGSVCHIFSAPNVYSIEMSKSRKWMHSKPSTAIFPRFICWEKISNVVLPKEIASNCKIENLNIEPKKTLCYLFGAKSNNSNFRSAFVIGSIWQDVAVQFDTYCIIFQCCIERTHTTWYTDEKSACTFLPTIEKLYKIEERRNNTNNNNNKGGKQIVDFDFSVQATCNWWANKPQKDISLWTSNWSRIIFSSSSTWFVCFSIEMICKIHMQ